MTPTDREQERAAVVSWLRAVDANNQYDNHAGCYALQIERGDHLTDRPAP